MHARTIYGTLLSNTRCGNARFFYAYDDGTAVWILNGYEKKTERIPKRELKRAKQLKRKYGL